MSPVPMTTVATHVPYPASPVAHITRPLVPGLLSSPSSPVPLPISRLPAHVAMTSAGPVSLHHRPTALSSPALSHATARPHTPRETPPHAYPVYPHSRSKSKGEEGAVHSGLHPSSKQNSILLLIPDESLKAFPTLLPC